MKRSSKINETVSSARVWREGAIRFVSDPRVQEHARRAAEAASDGVRRAQIVGYAQAMSDPRVVADLRATSDAIRAIANRTDPRSKRRRVAKVVLGVGVLGASACAVALRVRGTKSLA